MFKNYNFIFAIFLFVTYSFGQSVLDIKADNVQVKEDKSITIDVLKNDDLKDRSNLLIEIISKPQMGSAEVTGDEVIYTPNKDANGIDKFDYKVDIGTAVGTATVRVNIIAMNDPPTGLSLSSSSIKENSEGGTLIGNLIVDDPDQDDKYKFGLAKENRSDFRLEGSSLFSKRSFDFESEDKLSVTIQVTDSGDEKFIGKVNVDILNDNEKPFLVDDETQTIKHPENSGKIVTRLNVQDPDKNQTNVKYRLIKSDDKEHFKITRAGDLAFLRTPDYENPVDNDKDNIYEVSYKAIDSKDDDLFVIGKIIVKTIDEEELEVIALDKRKYIAWSIDHQPYHILMEDAIQNYIRLKYTHSSGKDEIEDGDDTSIQEMKATDQIIIVQQKGNSSEIHEVWYGNGLDFTIIDREKIDWVFSQDIQEVLIDKDEYLTSDSETVFHESEADRLMAGYGSVFNVWYANNFKMSLSTFSMRSNLLPYSSNMRVGNPLIGLPGILSGSSEIGVATQRSEFGIRLPFSFDFGKVGNYNKLDVVSPEYSGLYARGNIDNLFATKSSLHGLIGFTLYPSSSGKKLNTFEELIGLPSDQITKNDWDNLKDSTENINILDSYALVATTVNVPIKIPSVGRFSVSPGLHYLKIAHRLKDNRESAIDQDFYERTFFDQSASANMNEDSTLTWTWSNTALNDEGNSYTRLSSFYIRFDAVGQIGVKPKFVERTSFLDFIQISKVPFYEFSIQYISSLNTISTLNLNLSDSFGFSITQLIVNSNLKGNWMPDSKFWFGLNYRASF
tara:strand:+ start:525 stop:2882 length:2358 start_codon:yes stop_codon:yes gene_type:complete